MWLIYIIHFISREFWNRVSITMSGGWIQCSVTKNLLQFAPAGSRLTQVRSKYFKYRRRSDFCALMSLIRLFK